MSDPADTQRLIGDLLRLGTVLSVDHAARTCRVAIGDLVTTDLPFFGLRAGSLSIWAPPSIGEQVMVLSGEGDTEAGVVLPGLYSDDNPPPSSDPHVVMARFADGSTIAYDAAAHHLDIKLSGQGTADVAAPGGLTISGKVTFADDVVMQGGLKVGAVDFLKHVHPGVASGSAKSLPPQ